MLTCSRTWYNFIRIPLCPISLASPPWAKSSSSSNHLLVVQAITIHIFAEHFIYHILKLNPVSSITRNPVRYSMTFFSCLQATISICPTGDLGFKVWVTFLSGTFFAQNGFRQRNRKLNDELTFRQSTIDRPPGQTLRWVFHARLAWRRRQRCRWRHHAGTGCRPVEAWRRRRRRRRRPRRQRTAGWWRWDDVGGFVETRRRWMRAGCHPWNNLKIQFLDKAKTLNII